MNTYLIKSKIDLIKEARRDFLDLYGIDYTPFTRKIYFYFFVYNELKYIHKSSLNFIYSNADTWTFTQEPDRCGLVKEYDIIDLYPFLESYNGDLLLELVEYNDKFMVYKYVDGTPVDSITEQEFYYLRLEHDKMLFTPFYNSMTYNLVRTDSSIKLVDFKHFEPKDNKPFFIYLYNEENRVNTLYVEQGTLLEHIFAHLAIDYPVHDAIIIEY
jgi:hypothetical protein